MMINYAVILLAFSVPFFRATGIDFCFQIHFGTPRLTGCVWRTVGGSSTVCVNKEPVNSLVDVPKLNAEDVGGPGG